MVDVFGPPSVPSDFGPNSGLFVADSPGVSGVGARQNLIPSNRPAVSKRNLIHWLVPEGPIVEMYVNPQNINYDYKKAITQQRTKAGFVLQYWGPELTTLDISGTTGTSGIEGINVLYDIYQNEQLAMDPYALYTQAKLDQENQAGNFGATDVIGAFSSLVSALTGSAENIVPAAVSQPPTLASLAFTVEMYYSGQVFRGYYSNFKIIESSDALGLFNYNFSFVVTSIRGVRLNYLGWHKSATNGPSRSGPGGPPRSFGSLI